ncbi:MAG: hypothetical protein H0U74_21960 [Bradymonadaceae bacterium]|nr:hypothetical protein [Lujinxingiaceae bacterium]
MIRLTALCAWIVVVTLLSSGCATIHYDGAMLDSIATLNNGLAPENYELITDFEVEHRAVFIVGALVTLVDSQMEEAIEREMRRYDGNAVVNVHFEEVQTAVDVLIGLLQPAGGLVETRTIRIRGDVVRIDEEALAIRRRQAGP